MRERQKVLIEVICLLIILLILFVLLVNYHEEKEYRVIFVTNSEEKVDSVILKEGELIREPELDDRDGYEFMGWYVNDEKYDFSVPIKKDLTLEAHWQLKNNN